MDKFNDPIESLFGTLRGVRDSVRDSVANGPVGQIVRGFSEGLHENAADPNDPAGPLRAILILLTALISAIAFFADK